MVVVLCCCLSVDVCQFVVGHCDVFLMDLPVLLSCWSEVDVCGEIIGIYAPFE
jgi:hypothetical protein